MRVIYVGTGDIHSLLRHWFIWYVILPDGGLLKIKRSWFKVARDRSKLNGQAGTS